MEREFVSNICGNLLRVELHMPGGIAYVQFCGASREQVKCSGLERKCEYPESFTLSVTRLATLEEIAESLGPIEQVSFDLAHHLEKTGDY